LKTAGEALFAQGKKIAVCGGERNREAAKDLIGLYECVIFVR
jgi:hypothetical protein